LLGQPTDTPAAAQGTERSSRSLVRRFYGGSSQVLKGEQSSSHEELVPSGRHKAAADVRAP
jgi:hypothetical protein